MTQALAQSPLLAHRERLWPLVAVSLALHLAVVAAAAALNRSSARIDLGQRPIVAKLVRLGEKRPERLLPRKEAAPPEPAPTAPQAVPIPAAKPAPLPAPAPVPQAKPAPPTPARPAATRSPGTGDALASALSRVKRDKALAEPEYGDPSGDPLGDSSEGSAGDQYLALVERALRQSYILPATISARDRARLKATVVLYLDPNGGLLHYAFESRSGDAAFDAALERAIHAARLPPPPAELRQKYRTEGLGVVYRP